MSKTLLIDNENSACSITSGNMGANSSSPNQTSQNPLLPADGPTLMKTNGICNGTLQNSTKLTSGEKDETLDKEVAKSSELPTGSDLYPTEPAGNTTSSKVYVNNEKRGKILINLHNGKSFSLDEADYSKTVEQICREKLLKEFPNIGPAAIQLFGLGCFDPKRVPKILWKSPHSKFIPSNETQKFYLRIRYVPNYNLLDNLLKLGEDILRYLYYQFQDDFVKDRLHYIYDDPVKNSAKARGYAVLSVCIKGKLEGKDPCSILDKYGQTEVLPKREHERFWKKMKLLNNMKEKATGIAKMNASLTLNDWMILFVRDILQEIRSYGVEMYEARRPARNETVHVLVNVHGTISGVFLSQEHFSTIEDLRSISTSENFQNRMGRNVHLDRCNGCPEVLSFENQEAAESFVSGLIGFSRLIRDYYFSLCREMEPPSAKELIISRCHGPIESETALAKLRRKDLSPEFYILKQDIYKFDSYAVLFNNNGQLRKRLIHKKGNKLFYEDEQEQSFSNIKELITYLADVRGLLPKKPIPVRPRQEPVDVLRKLFVEDKILDEDEEELSARSKKKQHVVLLPEDVKIQKLIDMGSFTQVNEGELQDGKQVAIKFLRETNLAQMYHSYKPFSNAIQQMIRLDNPAYFVAIHGVCLTSPPMLVMEKASYGSLSKFFADRTTQQPIYLHHLMDTALHIAHGLLYMSENDIYHGNICCQNILVHNYAIEKIEVKIGDPGMITLLNQLPVNHQENIKRLPWIAPELLSDLKKLNTQTDMYAFGTTVWEMFSFGMNPMDLQDFAFLSTSSVRNIEKIKEEQNQKLPVPPVLVNRREDDDGVKKCKEEIQRLVKLCWRNAQDRSDASMMVRDIHALMNSYGGDYHNYSVIPDERLDDSWSDNHLTPRHKRIKKEVPQIHLEHPVRCLDIAATPEVKLPDKVAEVKPASTAVRPSPPTTNPPKSETVCTVKETRMETETVHTRKEKTWITRPLPDKPELDLMFLISSGRLEISRTPLGSGYYGEVKKGKLYSDHSDPIDIAAKELKGEYQNVLDSPDFKKEAILMSQLSHSNIVKFIGINDNRLILEFVENGSLSTYLRKLRKENGTYLEKSTMMKMVLDVAMGMKYLAEVNVIHCDLAGRNVLLTKDLTAKITDFGLAKILQENKDYYRRSKSKGLPACWCAPEGLTDRKFTTKGDVWSFGVLMWEVFTHAKAPLLCEEFSKYGLQKLKEGKRLQKPSHCPDEMYVLMKDCWEYNPQDRPDFGTISKRCREYLLTLPGQAVPELSKTDEKCEPTTNKIKTSDLQAALATVRQRTPSVRQLPPHQDITMLGLQKNLEIDQSPDGVLGKGQFGLVRKGVLQQDDGTKTDVAVKIFRNHDNSKDEIKLEIDILGSVEHRNVVKLYKYMNVPEVCIVMEYMKTGCLKKQLDKHKQDGTTMNPGLLMRICTDVAAGLDYLSGKNIVHCDLAARNILLTVDFQAKISDFGLSKLIIEQKDYYRRLKEWNMPFRWCAPEVIEQHILSSKGDVWSFAILMWECFSGGKVPRIVVNENRNQECSEMLEQLRKGERLRKPEACHNEIYSLMEKCWKFNREDRPNFNQIYTRCLQLQEELEMVVGTAILQQ